MGIIQGQYPEFIINVITSIAKPNNKIKIMANRPKQIFFQEKTHKCPIVYEKKCPTSLILGTCKSKA